MSEEYLWSGSGKPDPEVARLERILCELQWSGNKPKARPAWWRGRRYWVVAAAAGIAIAIAAMLFIHKLDQSLPLTSWQLSIPGEKANPVHAGQVIETGRTPATMESELIGRVDIDPDSRVHMSRTDKTATAQDERRLALDHGTIHALIWAPPTEFVVDTPGARAVDLGCEYTLSVAKGGEGMLTVKAGWVAFQWKNIESFIPQGAACTTRMGHGPDTPYFLDAPKAFTKSLAEFDLTGSKQALHFVLATARRRDALTLWHLLERTSGGERQDVINRFSGLVNLPAGVTQEGILRGDRKSMDAAWDALQLGDTSWWREWKRVW